MTAGEPATQTTNSDGTAADSNDSAALLGTAASSDGTAASLNAIERQRRHLWITAFVALVVVSLVVVVMSYWVDVLPDTIRDAAGFPGWRFVFLLVSIGFIAYAIERERMFRVLTRRLVEERRSAERLAEADRKRAEFIAGITHELKTPLTSLLGYATILRKRARTLSHEQRDEFVAVMEKQGQRILRLIEEMLQSSRLEAGLTKLQRLPLNPGMIVSELAREISVGRGRSIEVNVPRDNPELFGDPAAIEHVVTNLIDNALKYSDDDTTVHLSVVEDEGEVLLQVRDEGMGIDPEELPFIFERFQQSSNARGRASVGLGLYIVRNLVAAHGGRVWAESELGKGTTFTVALPRRRDR